MARITVEDCLKKIPSRFALVMVASQRAKQLLKGQNLTIDATKDNKEIVNSLREIADGKVFVSTEPVTPPSEADENKSADIEKEEQVENG